MSRTAHKLLAGSGGKSYEIEQSLMLPDDANAHLLKNISSAGNRKTWTWSGWVKRYKLQGSSSTVSYFLWSAYDNSTEDDETWFSLQFYRDDIRIGAWNQNYRVTSRLYRDLSAWYHIVCAVDTTQSTANDRVKLYVNGVQETGFDTTNNPSQNANLGIGNTTWHMLGSVNASGTTGYAKHYIAETHFIDGTALTADSFGETDSVTGQWIPKKYTGGSYGTNGYYLKFASGAIGTDSSGQGNNYTASNVADSDVMLDTPTNNFCTYNPFHNGSTVLSQGNLKFVNSSGNSDTGCTMQIPFTGKWYWEIRATAVDAMYYGIVKTEYTGTAGSYGSMGRKVLYDGKYWNGSSSVSYGSSYSDGDIVNVAFDCDNSKLYFGKNGTWQNSGDPANGTNPAGTVTASDGWFPNMYGNSGTQNDVNFGQNGTFNGLVTAQGNADSAGIGDFYYSPPSGFKALCSKNLPTPAVKKSTEHFNTILYTGNDTDDRTLSVGFQPDLVWIKTRNEAANWHNVYDSVRGVSKRIFPNDDSLELTEADPNNSLVAFTSDGFTVDDSSGHSDLNASDHYYVSYNWKAGGSGSSNTDGQESATVSANTGAGFSIVKFTKGAAGARTVGHGLGKKPKIVIQKRLDADENWFVYSDIFDGSADAINLDGDGGSYDWNNGVVPTSSVFTTTASNGATVVAYCFAEVEGFSKFGTYEANNSTDGPFVHTGFTPAWVVFKYFDGSGEWWWMFDNKRSWVQPNTLVLYPNAANAEATVSSSGAVDFLSNGFKIRATNGGINYQNTYMYMAFAEYPFKYANAR